MRIGVVTTSYPRRPDDPAGGFVAGMAHWLAKAGHHVQVVAAGPGMDRDGPITVHRVRSGAALFYDEGAPDRLERMPSVARHAPIFTMALAAAVARRRASWDAVVSHWLLPCGLIGAGTWLPHLAIAHSGDVHLATRLGLADVVAAILARSLVAFSAPHLRTRLIGAVRLEPLRRRLVDRSFVQAMGIDLATFSGLRRTKNEVPVVAYLGRLVPIKGVHVLIDAVARLSRRVSLVIAGAGPERVALERRTRTAGVHASFMGEVRGRDRLALLATADVLVVPSLELGNGRSEGMPTVALEGLAAGVPLIASATGGLKAALGEAAWWTPSGDALALARTIASVLDLPAEDEIARIEKGRTLVASFGWDSVGPRLIGSLLAS